jgi:hypothetical protein
VALWVLFASLGLSASVVAAESYEFEHVTCPGAASTELNGINDLDEVVGVSSIANGFRLSDGACISLCVSDFPNAFDREAMNINNRGDIVGGVADAQGDRGYLLEAGSNTCEIIDCQQGINEWTSDINEAGQVVDDYFDGSTDQGFEWSSGGSCEMIPPCPGATAMSMSAITNSGAIVGVFEDQSGRHVFRIDDWRTDLTCVVIPIPVPPGTTIDVGGINDNLSIVGTFVESGELGTAFLFENDTVTIIDPCPEAENCRAIGRDINNLGAIVGSYDLDGSDVTEDRIGFVASPERSYAIDEFAAFGGPSGAASFIDGFDDGVEPPNGPLGIASYNSECPVPFSMDAEDASAGLLQLSESDACVVPDESIFEIVHRDINSMVRAGASGRVEARFPLPSGLAPHSGVGLVLFANDSNANRLGLEDLFMNLERDHDNTILAALDLEEGDVNQAIGEVDITAEIANATSITLRLDIAANGAVSARVIDSDGSFDVTIPGEHTLSFPDGTFGYAGGFDAFFQVPEPDEMLLRGTALLALAGLYGLTRRRGFGGR